MSTIINLTLLQSTDFFASFQINDANNNPVNLTTLTIESQMKHQYTSNSSLTYTFNVNAYANGYLTLKMPNSNTATINAGSYVYDIVAKDQSNTLSRLIEGVIKVTPSVTQFV